MDMVTRVVTATRQRAAALWGRLQEECGEGVVSTAIAILVVALIGVALWGIAQGWLDSVDTTVNNQIQDLEGE